MRIVAAVVSTMLIFWYCYDDWLAVVTSASALGNVPFHVWLISWLSWEYADHRKMFRNG